MIRMFLAAALTAAVGLAATLWMGRFGVAGLEERAAPALEEIRRIVLAEPPEDGELAPGPDIDVDSQEIASGKGEGTPSEGPLPIVPAAAPSAVDPAPSPTRDESTRDEPTRDEPPRAVADAVASTPPEFAEAPADDVGRTAPGDEPGRAESDDPHLSHHSARLVRRMLALYRAVEEP